MIINPIKSERDYRRVLKEIESFMDAKANTAAGDRLDVLVTLAQAWENKHHAIDPPKQMVFRPPIDFKTWMDSIEKDPLSDEAIDAIEAVVSQRNNCGKPRSGHNIT